MDNPKLYIDLETATVQDMVEELYSREDGSAKFFLVIPERTLWAGLDINELIYIKHIINDCIQELRQEHNNHG